jgi:Fe-S oxidoreductase
MDLCVHCKGCRRECPTGVDMARMKTEFLHHWQRRHGLSLKDRLVATLPRWAPWAARLAPLANLRDRLPLLARLSERWLGLSARRTLPRWRADGFLRTLRRGGGQAGGSGQAGSGQGASAGAPGSPAGAAMREVVLWIDTFDDHLEPDNARAALRVLRAAGYRVHVAGAAGSGIAEGERGLCCGRTYLSAGLVDDARREALRTLRALLPFAERGVPIVGIEPSCLLTLRDEFLALRLDQALGRPGAARRLADRALLLEEFLAAEHAAGRLALALKALPQSRALVHGHCHQKAFDAFSPVLTVLRLIPGLKVEAIESSCCGMAGSFGYDAAHVDVSMRMAELALLPAVRAAGADTLIVADGTSCAPPGRRQRMPVAVPDAATRRPPDIVSSPACAVNADSSAGGPASSTSRRNAVDRSREARLTASPRGSMPRSVNTLCCPNPNTASHFEAGGIDSYRSIRSCATDRYPGTRITSSMVVRCSVGMVTPARIRPLS